MLDLDFQNEVNRRYKLQTEYLGNGKTVNLLNPLVSVCIQTYNHDKYIKECLDSVLSQNTNFDFEIILGEDDSKDSTRQICIDYANKYKNKIRLFLRDRETTQLKDENGKLLRRLNGIFTRMDARGKYIALCEGDDYWTDPLKLQKQVDFLEGNEEYSGCFHACKILPKNSVNWEFTKKSIVSAEDTISHLAPFHTATFVFRRAYLDIPEWSRYIQSGDMVLFSTISKYGPIFNLKENMSVYRRHSGGITSSNAHRGISYHNNRIKLIKNLNRYHDYKYNRKAKDVISYHKNEIKRLKVENRNKKFELIRIRVKSLKDKINHGVLFNFILKKLKNSINFRHHNWLKKKRARQKERAVAIHQNKISHITTDKFSIISSNCWGGSVYEDLKLPYQSPTVGLFFYAPCFIELLSDLKMNINLPLEFITTSKYTEANIFREQKYNYPIGKLGDKIEVHFLHYQTVEEATEKWERRKARIHWDKLFVSCTDRDGMTPELMKVFDALPYNKKVIFTGKVYKDIKCSSYLKAFKKDGIVGDLYNQRYLVTPSFNLKEWLV